MQITFIDATQNCSKKDCGKSASKFAVILESNGGGLIALCDLHAKELVALTRPDEAPNRKNVLNYTLPRPPPSLPAVTCSKGHTWFVWKKLPSKRVDSMCFTCKAIKKEQARERRKQKLGSKRAEREDRGSFEEFLSPQPQQQKQGAK